MSTPDKAHYHDRNVETGLHKLQYHIAVKHQNYDLVSHSTMKYQRKS